jgi:hypothetical protein
MSRRRLLFLLKVRPQKYSHYKLSFISQVIVYRPVKLPFRHGIVIFHGVFGVVIKAFERN